MVVSPANSHVNNYSNPMLKKKSSPVQHDLSLPIQIPLKKTWNNNLLRKRKLMSSTETVVSKLEQKQPRPSIGSWLRGIVKTNEFALLMLLLIGVTLVTSR